MPFRPVCDPLAPCKCCGTPAPLFGVVDSEEAEDARGRVFPLSGVPVYYHRCLRCGFLFTTAMDAFTPEDFRALVYNGDYALADPDYAGARPRAAAAWLARRFPGEKPGRLLDYGGGTGLLPDLLRPLGFPDAACYDPLVSGSDARPAGGFDCVCAFEVAEHCVDPAGAFADMAGLLADPGLILFSTSLQPPDIEAQGLAWWYAAPRNGHVSLFTAASLHKVARRLGLRFGSFDDCRHALFRSVPGFARHLIPAG